ncbi:c-type cytochrome [Meiothermus rufus]|uniref:c-type cytochrome n=1 Tax=Meiothermus rufus TaxID=604332 RepID=UPI00040B2B67|nr:cytochrome c [Meiothermus rufus]
MPIERIEVYLDDQPEPIQVIRQPPFKLKLDTRQIPDGEHLFRVETYFKGGGREIREIPFKVNNLPDVLVQGLEEGMEVQGELEVALKVGDPDVPVQPERFPSWVLALAAVVVLGGVWGFFALTPASQKIISEVAPPASEASAHGGHGEGAQAAAPADAAALAKEGEGIYAQNCAGCHQATGQGLPGVFPALAGNPKVGDKNHVINTVLKGRNAMPAFAQLSDQQVAAVLTYVRSSWGNSFGAIAEAEVKAAR